MLRLFAVATALGLLSASWAVADDIVFPGKEWEEVSPESQGLDAKKLAAAVDYLQKNAGRDGVHELLIVKSGRIVWKGDNIDKVHGVWSCTKSFTSTVLGLLIDDGKCSLDTKAKDYVPELAVTYPDVTLRHFTTMASGYRAVGDEPMGSYRHGPSATPLVPSDKPLFTPPGSQYAYWDSAMNMFGLVLTRIAEESMYDLFKRRIGDPIGMKWKWGERSKSNGIVVNGGSGNAGTHVQISAREFARFGHLLLNHGKWGDKQLLSREWIEEATAVHVPVGTKWAQPESEIDGRGVYGFNWWANGIGADDKRKWPGAPKDTYAAAGHNNNRLFVVPQWNMVIVRLGLDQADVKMSDEVWGRFLELVGEARK